MSWRDRWRKYARDFETLPGDMRLLYRRGGWSEVWEAVADRWVFRIVRKQHMLVIVQDLDRLHDVAPPAGVSIRVVDDGDWPALTTLIPMRELDRYRWLVSRGHTFVVAWRGAQPIGYTWYTNRFNADVTALPLPVPPGEAYLWDLYVSPAERRHGIGSALVTARLRLAREAGCRQGWRIVVPTNVASLRTVNRTKGDWRVVGEVRYVKIFARMFARYTPAPPDGQATE